MLAASLVCSEGKEVQEKLLQDLNEKVRTVYVDCGFESDAKPTTLTMLTDLEGKLEFLLAEMETMDPEYVEHAEKVCSLRKVMPQLYTHALTHPHTHTFAYPHVLVPTPIYIHPHTHKFSRCLIRSMDGRKGLRHEQFLP